MGNHLTFPSPEILLVSDEHIETTSQSFDGLDAHVYRFISAMLHYDNGVTIPAGADHPITQPYFVVNAYSTPSLGKLCSFLIDHVDDKTPVGLFSYDNYTVENHAGDPLHKALGLGTGCEFVTNNVETESAYSRKEPYAFRDVRDLASHVQDRRYMLSVAGKSSSDFSVEWIGDKCTVNYSADAITPTLEQFMTFVGKEQQYVPLREWLAEMMQDRA